MEKKEQVEQQETLQPQQNEFANQDKDRDIDLIDLIVIIWKFFVKYICKPIEFCFRFGLRKWWILVIIAIAGYAFSYCFNIFWVPKFETSLSYNVKYMHADIFVGELNSIILDVNPNTENCLGYTIDELRNIKGLRAYMYEYTDSTRTSSQIRLDDSKEAKYGIFPNRFSVEASCISDPEILRSLHERIYKHITSMPYVVAQKNERIKSIKSSLSDLNVELAKLDSLRNIEYFTPTLSMNLNGQIVESNNKNSDLSNQIISTKNNITSLENALQNTEVIELENTPIVKRPYNPITNGIKHTIMFVALGFVILLCIEYRKLIYAYIVGDKKK